MKIKINKLLTLCMVLFVLFTSAIPTMAQGDKAQTEGPKGTITYHTGKQDVDGVVFNVYRIMDATATQVNKPDQITEDLVAYTFNTNFEAFLESEILKDSQLTGETNELKAQEYLKKHVTEEAFQSSLKNEITNKNITPDFAFNGETGTTSYTCDNLPYGYYVIIPSVDTVSLSFTTLYSPTLDVYSKGLKPGVDKTIDDNKDKDSAQIGDEVKFTVKSTVPNMTGFDQYTFKLVDTLSKGLTFNKDSIKVSITGVDNLTPEPKIKVVDKTDTIIPNADNKTRFEIIIENITDYKEHANKEIVFKYSATLNEEATIDGNGNTNTAQVQYGNNPEALENSKEDVATVYTHTLTINKKDDGKPAKALAGAKFQIFKKTPEGGKGEIVKFIKDPKNEGTYRVATKAEIDANTATVEDTVVSPTSGTIVINGLDAASYLIYETKAPDGYNKLKQPIEITIKFDGNKVTNPTLDITNKKGTLLPETGGMGTLMFTIVGVVGILAVAYSFKPKKSKSE